MTKIIFISFEEEEKKKAVSKREHIFIPNEPENVRKRIISSNIKAAIARPRPNGKSDFSKIK
ncbi:hypothetical protein [Edaphocola aurantiacus]|uniref:hypothetical protein n=1 Tax=Edaphocola aurantiacus TaxID=2601682 RepID=UPI001C97B4A7|nr:hypothetical protein [Edaphocola aurantiacus]